MIGLLYYIFIWLPTRPVVGLGNSALVRIGLKWQPATGEPKWWWQ